MRLSRTRIRAVPLVALAGAVLLGACGTGGDYDPTSLPQTPTPTASPSASAAEPAACTGDVTASFDPVASLQQGAGLAGVREVAADEVLTVGVSADTRLLGARNPENNDIEGFDIEAAQAVATALTEAGLPVTVSLKVITAADRIPLLESGAVDLVARNMTITCDRWTQINFSATYYLAGQKLLVASASPVKAIDELEAGSRVCAPTGSTSLAALADFPDLVPVAAGTHTACLVQLQQGQADAITGDDTVLAGLAAQDPYTKVVGDRFTNEPYGLGIAQNNVDFTRFVNAALDQWRAEGGWQRAYDRWLAPVLQAGTPPTPVYGRPVPAG